MFPSSVRGFAIVGVSAPTEINVIGVSATGVSAFTATDSDNPREQ